MFGKKKKRLEISAPSNFEHRVHTGFDPREQKFTGLPQQWQSLLADTANRPKPMVDPSYITPIQLAPMKVEFKNPPPYFYLCFLALHLSITSSHHSVLHLLHNLISFQDKQVFLLHHLASLFFRNVPRFCSDHSLAVLSQQRFF